MRSSPRLRRAATAAGATLALSFAAVAVSGPAASADPARNAVYTESNATAGNSVLAFHNNGDGTLTPIGAYTTAGNGTGSGLGSQGALVVGDNDHTLVAVNAGSNTISAFKIAEDGQLRLLDTIDSGGISPISVAIHDRDIYVLNATSLTIAGFELDGNHLRARADAVRSLSPTASGPAQVAFTPDGTHLVVTEKATNALDTFTIDHHGRAGDAVSSASNSTTPFGFGFDAHGHAIVSDAGAGPATAAVSSHVINDQGAHTISVVGDTQTAACWIAISPDGRHAYTTNAASGTVSAYAIGADGTLTLTNPTAIAGAGHPTDETVGGTAASLFVLDTVGQRLVAAPVNADGTLGTSSTAASGLPATAVGVAATRN